jgi:hypothetical protein
MAASGSAVLSDRDTLAATIAPVTGSAAEAMTRATRRAERIAAKLIASTTGAESLARQRPVTDEGLTAVQAAISTYREVGTPARAGGTCAIRAAARRRWVSAGGRYATPKG